MNNRPPKIAETILSKLLYDDVWKTTLGDFEEQYSYLLEKEGKSKANRWYWSQVLRYAPSKIIHKLYWTAGMFKNYLKISLRNLRKNKSYSFINTSGLAIGLASFLLIGLFVQHELSYDKHFEDSEQIYRVVRERPAEQHQGSAWHAVTPIPLHSGLKDNFSHFDHTTYVSRYEGLIRMDESSFFEKGLYAGGEFFQTFSYTWLQGNPATALDDPSSIILTESLAEKLFGNKNPVGESLEIIPEYETEPIVKMITGVIEDLPQTSHLFFHFVTNEKSSSWHEGNLDHWDSNGYFTYAKLNKENTLNVDLLADITEYYNAQMMDLNYYGKQPHLIPKLAFQPLHDIHLKSSHLRHSGGTPGDIKYVYIFSLIGLIILLIACVNYMNLATARAVMRAKEVGVRKVIGALRSNLIMQFISEAVLLSFFSISFAVLLVWLFLEPFSSLINRNIGAGLFMSPLFWISVLGISSIIGILAGSYPAFYMSSLKPAGIFKSHTKGGKGNSLMRNTLVTGQFAITTILIICSIVIFQQMDYIRSADVGYTRDQILTVRIKDENFAKHYDTITQRLITNPHIVMVSSGESLPTEIQGSTSGVNWSGREERVQFYRNDIGYNYLEMLDINLITGRYFSEDFPTDAEQAFILNKSAVKGMGFTPEEVIGTTMKMWQQEGPVVGVIEDFNFLSFRDERKPLILSLINPAEYDYLSFNYLLLKVRPENLPETIAFVEKTVTAFSPDYPFEYSFLDDAFDNIYRTDINLGTLFNAFTILALFIASIGLFGLASFMMEQRAKEIGIRKVLGANLVQILTLVNKDFMKLIGLSFVIAVPIGWYAMNTWLQDFAYKISLGPSIFIAAGLSAIVVALITVSYKSFKTASTNPVNSLRSE
ncbi:MAG: ABC transporter permease [Balneolaceae bacterium]